VGRPFKDRTGETRMMNCGMQATIIAYRGSQDIDVQFEDSTIIKNRKYQQFVSGEILNPNLKTGNFIHGRVGETHMMNCGMQATIIAYRGFADIDIQFEDETVVKTNYRNFKTGHISHPNLGIHKIGEIQMMNCGMQATIITYRGSQDIDIQFEDGTIVKNKQYHNFLKGRIAYPNKSINNIEIGSEIYKVENRVYYNCTCQKCHSNMMLTLQEMLQHHC
jgi:predicted nucleic-acid-binding Zn-ribbon protein